MKRNDRIGSYKLPVDSPRIITSIAYQKRDKLRASVSIDDAFAFGINIATIERFRLRKGDELTSVLFDSIREFDDKASAKRIASKYLNTRRRSEREVASKLRGEGFDDTVVAETTQSLKEYGLINDEELAQAFIHDKLLTKAVSKRELEQYLRKKGIAKETIVEALKKISNPGDEEEHAKQAAEKKWSSLVRRETDPKKRKQKLYAFLASRGFEGSTIKKIVAQLSGKDEESFEE
ncbi:MAG TPA: RecX family transcriptional regulator [Candidatus Kapabacteria bacterium]|nr:RecX family transcriptional regulator [Candidatus Kapabacteria bacterium]